MTTKQVAVTNPDHDDSGRFKSKRDPDDYIDAIREQGGMASTNEVADAVGVKYRTAHHNLSKHRDAGRVTVRDVGGSFLWIADDGDDE